MPVSLLGGSGRSRGPTATRKCSKCGYALLANQSRCPECGGLAAAAVSRGRHRIIQLYQQGPETVRPIAIRFAAMGAVAAAGPLMVALNAVLGLTLGIGIGIDFGAGVGIMMATLPLAVLISMPFGWGSIGGSASPVPVERVRVLGFPIHLIALATCPAWWFLAAILAVGVTTPMVGIAALLCMVAAATSAYFHLCWLADLGFAIADESPHRVLNVCVGIAIICIIVAIIAALFATTWSPFLLALALVVLSVVFGEVVASVQLARDMISTLIGAYEEVGRQQRRAERAAENEPRFPA